MRTATCLTLIYFFLPGGKAQPVDLLHDGRDTIKIKTVVLDTVMVNANAATRRNNTYLFSSQEAKTLITIMGETDVLRYITTLPGVSQGMEGGLGMFVRGSNGGNNRFLLDDVPLYGSDHLFGLFSVIHPDIVGSVDFRSGKFSAAFGNFLSSLTRINTVVPSKEKFSGSFSVSPFMAGGSVSRYFPQQKIGFQVAGRISLLKPELALIAKLAEMEGRITPETGDLYLKMFYSPTKNHTLEATCYYSNDYFKFTPSAEDYEPSGTLYSGSNTIQQNWGTKMARLAWEWQPDDISRLLTSVYFDDFASGQRQQFTAKTTTSDLRLETSLREWSFQTSFAQKRDHLSFETGVQAKIQKIQPAAERIYTDFQSNKQDNYQSFNPVVSTHNASLFANLEYQYKNTTSTAGYRGYQYRNGNHGLIYHDFRLSFTAELAKGLGVEISYDRLTQFQHVVEGLPVGWSLDLIIPADNLFVPEKSSQYYAGGFWTRNEYSVSAGLYYKDMRNVTSYRNAINIFGVQNTNWSDDLVRGIGESYGLETRIERRGDDWNASLSYTLSKTNRQFDEINLGRVFPFKFDRRHVLNLAGRIRVNERKLSSRFFYFSAAYTSGHHITIPIAMYKGIEPPFWSTQSGPYVPPKEKENALYRQFMSEVNGYTLPFYFRIDVGYNIHKIRRKHVSDLDIGIFNLLNRRNPYLVFYDEGRWKQLSIFPIIPSVKWIVSF